MSQNFQTVLVALGVFVLVLALMAWGWRNRKRAQTDLYDTLPPVPAEPGEIVLGPLSGVYIGSTMAGDWQSRIASPPLGHRSAGTFTAHTGGLRLDLAEATVWIPRGDLEDVRRDYRLANKVVPGGGLLVARWHAAREDGSTTVIDSGFRADDKDDYHRWEALRGDAATADDHPDTPRSTTEEK